MKTVIISEALQKTLGASITGATILSARTAEEALKLHREHKTDLIIADAGFPGMGGVKLCKAIRNDASRRDVSIILVGVSNHEASESGANMVLPPPVDPADLKNKAMELLNVMRRERMQVLMKVAFTENGNKQSFFTNSRNVSTSGLLFESDHPLKKGDWIVCSFFVSNFQVAVDAEIMRVDTLPGGLSTFGVRFLSLAPEAKDAIEKFIASRDASAGRTS
ncbi:MAG: PilZ domain-containing protein [Nitrospiraceae bacterium]|nr:PilZ domain-containing protein [Nitrospiraceae bacterium]